MKIIKKITQLVKDMFTVDSVEGFIFVVLFWFVLIIGGGSLIQTVGQYLLNVNPDLANKFGLGATVFILIALFTDPVIQTVHDIKRDGGFFIKRK